MPENPYNHRENQGCKPLAPLLAQPLTECVQAGGDSEPQLSPLGGVQAPSLPIGLAPHSLHPLRDAHGTPETDFRVDPLAVPGVTRILLSEASSRHLVAQGEAFAIVGRSSFPDQPGRMAIFCQAVPLATATAACQILAGTHRAQRIKPPASAPPSQPQSSRVPV